MITQEAELASAVEEAYNGAGDCVSRYSDPAGQKRANKPSKF